MDSVNFKATKVCPTKIKVLKQDGTYASKNAYILKMNKNSKSDRFAMYDINKLWSWGAYYVESMLLYLYQNSIFENRNIYILTTQKDNYRKIVPKKVLGLVEFTKKTNKVNRIDYIESHPDNRHTVTGRKYAEIGSAMMNFIKKLNGKRKLYLSAVNDEIEFYRIHGFRIVENNTKETLMVYEPKK